MLNSDKTILIQDLQCRHASWLSKYNQSLSLGDCPDDWINKNIAISNYIKVLYRYAPFTSTVTNADSVTIVIIPNNTIQTYNVSISYGAVNLVTFSGTGDQASIIDEIVLLINSGTNTHKYYCVNDNNVLYLYTYNVAETFSSVPTVIVSESDINALELSYSTSSILESDTAIISDLWSCISEDDFCDIVCKAKDLMGDCNCN